MPYSLYYQLSCPCQLGIRVAAEECGGQKDSFSNLLPKDGRVDDHRVLTGERKVAHWGALNIGGAAWLQRGLFCPVSFFPPTLLCLSSGSKRVRARTKLFCR